MPSNRHVLARILKPAGNSVWGGWEKVKGAPRLAKGVWHSVVNGQRTGDTTAIYHQDDNVWIAGDPAYKATMGPRPRKIWKSKGP